MVMLPSTTSRSLPSTSPTDRSQCAGVARVARPETPVAAPATRPGSTATADPERRRRRRASAGPGAHPQYRPDRHQGSQACPLNVRQDDRVARKWLTDVSAASWIEPRLNPFGQDT